MVRSNTGTQRVAMTDITVGESLLRNANNIGKSAWWLANATGSFSKVLAVSVANSDVKAIRVIDDLDYGEIAEHGANSGFDVIDSISNVFASSKKKVETSSSGLGVKKTA